MDIPVITVGKAPVPSGDISGLSTAMPRGFLCRWAAHEWFFFPRGTGAGVRGHRGQPHGRDDRAGPRAAQARLLAGFRGSPGAPAPVAQGVPAPRDGPSAPPDVPLGCGEGAGVGVAAKAAPTSFQPRGVSGCVPPVPNGDLWDRAVSPSSVDTRLGEKPGIKPLFPPVWGCSVWCCHLCKALGSLGVAAVGGGQWVTPAACWGGDRDVTVVSWVPPNTWAGLGLRLPLSH